MSDESIIEHTVSYAFEYNWGYLKWAKSDNNLYQKVFPCETFEIIFDGKRIKNRKVDWEKAKLSLIPVKDKLSLGTVLIIQRNGNIVKITTKK